MSIETLEESHASLFSLPGLKCALGAALITVSFFSFAEFIIRGSTTLVSFIFTSTCFLVLIFLFPLLATVFLKKKKTAITFRRSLWGSLLSVSMGSILYLLGLLLTKYLGLFLILGGIGLKVFWDFLLIYSFSYISVQRGVIIALPGPLIFSGSKIFFLDYIFLPYGNEWLLLLPTIAIFLVAGWGVTFFADFIGRLRTPIGGGELFRGFAIAWLGGEREVLENTLERMSTKRKLPIYLSLFKGKEVKGIWIIPTVHPGPLLNVGSSDMTIRLSSALREKYNAPVMVFHGSCTHSENLPSLSEQRKFIAMIMEKIDEVKLAKEISPLLKVKNKKINIFSQLFGKHALLSISSSPTPMDDITLEVGQIGSLLAENEGLEGAIIDTHNSIGLERKEGKRVRVTDDLAEEIFHGIRKGIKKLKQVPEVQKVQEVSFGMGRSSGNLTIREGLGPEGIKVSLIGMKGKKYAYILLDSNNLESGLREEVLNMLKEMFGIDAGEVYTSDTHIMNATGSEGGYPLINRRRKSKLLEGVRAATEEALEKMENVNVYNSKIMVNLQVQGEKSASALTDFANHAVNLFYFSLLICLLPAFLSTFLVSFLPFL